MTCFFKHITAPSKLHGTGLYTEQPIKKKTICIIFDRDRILTELEYLLGFGDKETAVRLVDKYWLDVKRDKLQPEDYINHSFKPNLVYHCGIAWASRNIHENEELYIDYRHFLSADLKDSFTDISTGEKVTGYQNKESLIKSLQELLDVFQI